MRRAIFTCLSTLLITSLYAQSPDELIGHCLNTSDFFLLEEIYPEISEEIQSPMLKSFAETLLHTVFNQPSKAVEAIDSLISNHQDEIGIENIRNMLMYQSWIFFRQGDYQQGHDKLKSFISQTESYLPEDFFTGLKGMLKLYSKLLNENRPMLVRSDRDCIIPYEVEDVKVKGNENDTLRHPTLMFIPVTVNGRQERFIFDTGCGGGLFLSRDFADKLGVRIVMDSLAIAGVGGQGYGQMGILDSLQVGNMTFKNVLATIAPPNPQVDSLYKIDAVLGEEIMVFAGEVQIFTDRKEIVFPINKTPLPKTGRNMMRILGGDAFYVKTYSNSQRLTMLLDTGNTYCELNGKYYQEHRDDVEIKGIKSNRVTGGFGGASVKEFYTLPSFELQLGNTRFAINNMTVESQPSQEFGDGSLGMAFINSLKKVTINFDSMFVEVE